MNKKEMPLTIAFDHFLTEIGEILISKGVDINVKNIIYQIIKVLFLINLI